MEGKVIKDHKEKCLINPFKETYVTRSVMRVSTVNEKKLEKSRCTLLNMDNSMC